MRLTASAYPNSVTQQPRSWTRATMGALMVLLSLLVVTWLDYVTGTAPIQHLYYLPIILAAFFLEYWGGLTCALAAIISYHLVNEHLRTLNYLESDYLQVALFLSVGAVRWRPNLDDFSVAQAFTPGTERGLVSKPH